MEKAKASTLKRTNAKKFLQVLKGCKQIQEELKELKQHSSIDPYKSTDFETSVIIGERLWTTKGVKTGENVMFQTVTGIFKQ